MNKLTIALALGLSLSTAVFAQEAETPVNTGSSSSAVVESAEGGEVAVEESSSSSAVTESTEGGEVAAEGSSSSSAVTESTEGGEVATEESSSSSAETVVVDQSSSSAEGAIESSSSAETVVVDQSSSSAEGAVESSSSAVVPKSVTYTFDEIKANGLTLDLKKGEAFDSIIVTGVTSFERTSWDVSIVSMPYSENEIKDEKFVIAGKVLETWVVAKDYSETFKINGETVVIKVNVTNADGSFDSSSSVASSSSEAASSSSAATAESSSAAAVTSSAATATSSAATATSSAATATSSAATATSSAAQAIVAAKVSAFKASFAHNVLTVSANKANVKINVFDMLGQSVASAQSMVSGSYSMNLSDLRKGSYLVRVISGNDMNVIRVDVR